MPREFVLLTARLAFVDTVDDAVYERLYNSPAHDFRVPMARLH
jgi:hypothetical protein